MNKSIKLSIYYAMPLCFIFITLNPMHASDFIDRTLVLWEQDVKTIGDVFRVFENELLDRGATLMSINGKYRSDIERGVSLGGLARRTGYSDEEKRALFYILIRYLPRIRGASGHGVSGSTMYPEKFIYHYYIWKDDPEYRSKIDDIRLVPDPDERNVILEPPLTILELPIDNDTEHLVPASQEEVPADDE